MIRSGKKTARESSPALAENLPNKTASAAPYHVVRTLQVAALRDDSGPSAFYVSDRLVLEAKEPDTTDQFRAHIVHIRFPTPERRIEFSRFYCVSIKLFVDVSGVEITVSETTYEQSEQWRI